MQKKWLRFLAVGMMAVSLVVSGCGGEKEKVLRVGSETTYPPFEFSEGEKYVGFDVELTEALAKQMGYKWEFRSMGFDALIPALQSNQIDVAAAAMDVTPERAKQVDFTKVYFDDTGYVVLVRKEETAIKGLDDLTGKTIGVQVGTKPVEIASAVSDAEVRQFDANTQSFLELTHGNIDAVIIDKAVGMYYLNQGAGKDLKMVGDAVDKAEMVMAVKKGNTQLQSDLNKALDELKANGEYQKIYEKWFGKKE